MKICILGAGLQGRIAAQDLAQNNHQVTAIDINKDNLNKIKETVSCHPELVSGSHKTLRFAQSDRKVSIKTKLFDVTKKKELIKLIRDFDIVVGALPAKLGFYSMQCAIEAKTDMADMSYSGEDPFLLDKQAKKNKVRIVPDAGYAPGLSNILIGEAYRELGKINNLRILVGGIPQHPIPPFNYKYTWSPNDLVQEYTRPARIVNNYKVIKVEALTGIEELRTGRTRSNRLECFYTDGLRTLIHTFKDIRNMEEKTIRYAGHAELMKELLNYGFLHDEDNPFTNNKIQPKDFILDFISKEFNNGDELDMTILLIDIKGNKKTRRYTCIDYYDKKNKITSMARMTAYSGSIITQCLKNYPEYGIIAPEKLGMDKDTCEYIKKEVARRGIKVKTSSY